MANIERMRENLAAIRKYPHQHAQADWMRVLEEDGYISIYGDLNELKADNGDHPPCGTQLCFAGWDAFLHAPKGSRITQGVYLMMPGQATIDISDFAQMGMGLTNEQESILFYKARSIEDLEALTDAIEADPEIGWQGLCQAALNAALKREKAEDRNHWRDIAEQC